MENIENKNHQSDDQNSERRNANADFSENLENTENKNDTENVTDKPDSVEEKESVAGKVNYDLLKKEDLVNLLEEWLATKGISDLGNEVNEIHNIFLKKQEAELENKKQSFLENGGLEEDFKPVEDPASKKMAELIEKYKSLRAEFNKQLEVEKERNLAEKKDILEQFRILVENPESFDSTFRKFKHLQRRWFEIGIVPRQNVKDLWNSYNFFVDKFNDYVAINKELRDLDYKKNYDQKIQLCEKAEELKNEKNIASAFKKLQKYHAQWREIGRVPIEEKDKIWERFKAATTIINKLHQEYQSNLKSSLAENYKLKSSLCEKAESLAADVPSNHKQWVQKTNELLAIQKEWKTIGYAPKKVNNQVYSRFRKACDQFFEKKAEFYAKNFEEQKEHLKDKRAIVEEAEKFKDSSEWKTTTDKLINLQKKWKETGPVPNKESDKLWKRFRAACDHFFARKSNYYSGDSEAHVENLKLKQALIEQVKAHNPSSILSDLVKDIEQYQNEYYEIGFVPIEKKDVIRDEFRHAIEDLIERSELSKDQQSLIRFRVKIKGILSSPKSNNKIAFERDKLVNKLQSLRNDLSVLENNVGFFKQTSSSEDTINDFQKKIDESKARIDLLENKIDIIDELDPID